MIIKKVGYLPVFIFKTDWVGSRLWLSKNAQAYNYIFFVLAKPSVEEIGIEHELVHTKQALRAWILPHIWKYFIMRDKEYKLACELEAYQIEFDHFKSKKYNAYSIVARLLLNYNFGMEYKELYDIVKKYYDREKR